MSNNWGKDSHADFSWFKIGDIRAGRPNLGPEVPVTIYRLFEYSMFDILAHRLGREKAQELFRETGHKAGTEFAHNVLELTLPVESFLAQLAAKLLELKIGVLRIESLDKEDGSFTLTVGEDLDCSGLPVTGEVVCNYDEGFIAGVLEAYFKKKFLVREVDCWASGAKVCRFVGSVLE